MSTPADAAQQLQNSPAHRTHTRERVSRYLDLPASLAALLMLLLAGLQFSGKVGPAWRNPPAALLAVIWLLFVVELAIKIALSPDKQAYLRTHSHHVLFALLPVIALVRLIGPLRSLLISLIRLLLPTSPEAQPYIAALKRRKLGQLAIVSALVILIGATVEYFFESGAQGSTIDTFGAAVWWSAATATTVANQLYPVTTGGEVVGFLMMVYAVCVFGYLASSLASVFIAGDAQQASDAAAAGDADTSPSDTDGTQTHGSDSATEPQPAEDGMLHLSPGEIQVLRGILARLEQTSPGGR